MNEKTVIGKIMNQLREFDRIKPQPAIPEDGEVRRPYPTRDPEETDESYIGVCLSMGLEPHPYK